MADVWAGTAVVIEDIRVLAPGLLKCIRHIGIAEKSRISNMPRALAETSDVNESE